MLEPKTPNKSPDGELVSLLQYRMPKVLQDALLKFLLDKRSGNFRINVHRGEICSYHAEEIVRVK